MWRISICCWAWLLCGTGSWADDPAEAKPRPTTPAEQYKAIETEYNTRRQEVIKLYREAKTDEERQKLLQEKKKPPSPQEYADRMLDLAKDHPDDPAAVDALTWVVMHVSDARSDRALEALREHPESDRLSLFCQIVGRAGLTPNNEQFLRQVLERNKSHEVQAYACLSLAQALKRQAERDRMNNVPTDKMSKEAEQLFERVVNDFGDVKTDRGTPSESAESELFELRHLAIGKLAPEIEGEDLNGEPFKLSDYRVKVVMLDFWGNW
ncbi:MAG TPA: hypothetical protein VFW87_06265 [Pirellulales bacterium]|nr:hypothetical protein [Pirellulales bacterium]